MKKVLVLMSTFNGELYLKEQIDSILNQIEVDVYLLVRDDGSSDSTTEILRTYQNLKNVNIIFGDNIGISRSYRYLIKVASEYDVDFYSFSDQDDVWLSEKLARAIDWIDQSNQQIPIAYCSNLNVVDSELNHIYFSNRMNKEEATKGSALVQNIATGCTMVFNRKARDLFEAFEPKMDTLHDYWLMLICVYIGELHYDVNTYILYRQHQNNAIGLDNSFKKVFKRIKISISKRYERPRETRAREFLSGFSSILSEEDISLILILVNYRTSFVNKVKLLVNPEIRMLSRFKNILLRLRIMINSV